MSLEHTLEEIAKLERIEQLGLPTSLFAQTSPKLLQQYRQRIVVEEIHEIRRHPDALRWALLAAYCWLRRQEIIDILVDLLLDMAHHLSTKAERRVEQAFVREIKKKSCAERRTTPDENALCFSVERTQRKVGGHTHVTQLANQKMNPGVWLNHTLLS